VAAAGGGDGGGGGGRRVRFNKAAQVAAVFETVLGARATQREYVGVLKVVWEGTLYEYLRAEGLGAQADAKRVDPRESVLKHWRRAEVAGTAPLAHVDALLPRTVRVAGRLAQATTDPTALALLANVASAESALKAMERLLRDGGMLSESGYGGGGGGGGGRHHCPLQQQQNQNHNQSQLLRRGDPDLMAAFASRVTELRRVERDGRQYLASACASAGTVAEHADPPVPARRAAASWRGQSSTDQLWRDLFFQRAFAPRAAGARGGGSASF